MGFLDAMKDLRNIPDIDLQSAVNIFSSIVKSLKPAQLSEIVKYALLYPPRVRALLGAILELNDQKKGVSNLKQSLNPLSQFEIGIAEAILPTASNWNIK